MRWTWTVVLCLTMLVRADRAAAVIAVKATMRDVWLGSDLVLIGKAAGVDKERSSVEVTVVEVLKGQTVGEKVVVQFVNQPALFERVKVGQSIVVMNARGQQRHSVHVGDTWTVAEKHEGAKLPKWNVVADNADMQKTFPGGTAALAEALRLQKQGKLKMEVKWDDGRMFPAGFTKAGVLPVKGATRISAVDVDGDKVAEIVVRAPHGTRLFRRKDNAFMEGPGVTSPPGADEWLVSDGTIRLSRTGELSDGEKKIKLWEGGEATAAIMGDFGDTGGAGVIVAQDGGLFRYSLAGQETAASDFARLTGERLATYHPADGGKMRNTKLVGMDFNGDQRMDLVVIADDGMFAMLNRGHGAFFASTVAVKSLVEGGPKRTTALWAGGDLRGDGIQSLIALDEDGTVYEAPSSKP